MNDTSSQPADSQILQANRTETGQFAPGHSGNPAGRAPGTRNRATVLAEQLLDGQSEVLARKLVAMALDGDRAAMRLCMDRILAPRRHRGAAFELPPIRGAADLAPATAAIADAAAQGIISTTQAAEMGQIVELHMRAIEAGELDRRLRQLEAVNGLSSPGTEP